MMNSLDRGVTRRKSLKERLGFVGLGCCGNVRDSSNMELREEEERQELENQLEEEATQTPAVEEDCVSQIPVDEPEPGTETVGGMNLATALAAERQFRAQNEGEGENVEPTSGNSGASRTPFRVSLMRLLEEGDGVDEEEEKKVVQESDGMCCVCMGRRKGAAFIPCGHTFCRVCSRELWLNRGSCPICNRSIVEILDIF